ncbi:MAG TPA: hypothetical protein VGM02_11915 [Acidobacteriaceae bacterium]|jgi:hypothetical protein
MTTQRNAIKIRTSAILIATLAGVLLGAPFRCCRAEEGREHGPPANAVPAIVALNAANEAPLAALSSSTLLIAPSTTASVLAHVPRGVELRHALIQRTITHTFWGMHEHFRFTTAANNREERQRRQVAIQLGRAVSQRGDQTTANRIAEIYESLRPAQWGRHTNGLLGGHFNFDYSMVRCADFDRLLPHGRYGIFASLHFHHDEARVHVDVANPFGLAGLLMPVHFFADVIGGHLPRRNRRPSNPEVALTAQPLRGGR